MKQPNVLVSYMLAIFSGILLFLSMPSYVFSFLAWFGFVPLLLSLHEKTPQHQFWLINTCTVVWSIGTHIWYPAIFSYWGYLIMIAGGLFYGAFLKMGYDMQTRIKSWYGIFAIPITFSVFEWVKTIIPFTKTWWIELLAKSQWTVPENLQILSMTGFIGLSFLLLLTNVCLAEIIKNVRKDKKQLLLSSLLLLLPIGNYVYGIYIMKVNDDMLRSNPITIGATVDMINQDEEVLSLGSKESAGDGYVADTEAMKTKIFDINRDLSRNLVKDKDVDFIVWGENEFMNLTTDSELYREFIGLSKELHTHIAADTVWQTKDTMYDTAVLIGPNGEEVGRTPKIFTLWGEVEFGFTPGPRDFPTYQTEHGEVALAVCWDRHDQSIIRNYSKHGAKILLIPADDDFYGDSRFPYFAASDAVFRAVENHVAIGSGSTSGIAQVITPYGEMTASSNVNQRQAIVGDTFILEKQTFYTKYGEVFAYLFAAIFVVMLFVSERNKRKEIIKQKSNR
ncbi:nitrilase-related carbon-nitrogen hydrolase [Fredinandcohnia humi]